MPPPLRVAVLLSESVVLLTQEQMAGFKQKSEADLDKNIQEIEGYQQ
jgi:hypothetical protein